MKGGEPVFGLWRGQQRDWAMAPFCLTTDTMYFNLRNIGFEKNFFTLVSDKGHKMWLVYIQITSPYPMADGHEVLMLLGFLTSSPPYCYR